MYSAVSVDLRSLSFSHYVRGMNSNQVLIRKEVRKGGEQTEILSAITYRGI